MPETEEHIRRKRLRFRSWHRGTRELDLMLGRFADRFIHALTTEQLDRYEALVDQPDPDLSRWLSGGEAPPAAHDTDVLDMIKNIKVKIE